MDNSSTQNYSQFRIFLAIARSKDQEVGTRQKKGVGVAFFPCYACGRLRYVPQPSLRFRQRHRRGTCQSLLCLRTTIATHKQARKKTLTPSLWRVSQRFVLQFSIFYLSEGSEKKERGRFGGGCGDLTFVHSPSICSPCHHSKRPLWIVLSLVLAFSVC